MKVIDFILCEDIRKEEGNKHTLIGIFDEEINFLIADGVKDVWPKPIRIGIFIRVKTKEKELLPDKFELKFLHEGKEFGGGRGVIQPVNDTKMLIFILKHDQFPLPGEGNISFVLKFYKSGKLIEELSPDYQMRIRSVLGQPAQS